MLSSIQLGMCVSIVSDLDIDVEHLKLADCRPFAITRVVPRWE